LNLVRYRVTWLGFFFGLLAKRCKSSKTCESPNNSQFRIHPHIGIGFIKAFDIRTKPAYNAVIELSEIEAPEARESQ